MKNTLYKGLVIGLAAVLMGLTTSSEALADRYGYYREHHYWRTNNEAVVVVNGGGYGWRHHRHHFYRHPYRGLGASVRVGY